MSNRLRGDFLNGIVSSITAGNPSTLTLAAGLNIAIPSGYYLPIVLNPPPYAQVSGTSFTSEIIWTIGSYSVGTTAFTVLRGQEGTGSLGAQTNIPFAVGPTVQDFGITNWIQNGDFPGTVSGTFLVSTGSSVASVVGSLVPSGLANNQLVGISGGQVVGVSIISGVSIATTVMISGSQINGALTSITISGNQIVGTIGGSQVSGYLSNSVISGSQVYGYLSNSTISGSQVIGNINATQIVGNLSNATISFSQVSGTAVLVSGYLPNASISGSQIYGPLTNSTIPGSSVTGIISGTQISGTLNKVVIASGTINYSTIASGTILTPIVSGGTFTVPTITAPIETVQLYSLGLSGTQTINLNNGTINYFTVASSGNFVINATFNGGTISGSLGVGQSISFVIMNTNGTTAYVLSGFQIDSVPQALHWQGGSAPTQGSISATDYYSFSIIKTNASPTYWVSAGTTKFV